MRDILGPLLLAASALLLAGCEGVDHELTSTRLTMSSQQASPTDGPQAPLIEGGVI
jgi:hypothetical protein